MTHIKSYITRSQRVQAVRVTAENIRIAASLCRGTVIWADEDQPYIRLDTKQGTVKVRIGMFVVELPSGWVGMTAKNFHRKYQLINARGDRVPPYTTGLEELESLVFPPYDR